MIEHFDDLGYREPVLASVVSDCAADIVEMFRLERDIEASPELWDNLRDVLTEMLAKTRQSRRTMSAS